MPILQCPDPVNAWLGGLDADFDGNFTWITDEVWEYENWEAASPIMALLAGS